jgi:NAD dependent epimerase/dehydratase family enzyme
VKLRSHPHIRQNLWMMLTVLGGSGRIGRHVVEQALGVGHDVTVLVRCADHPQPPMGSASWSEPLTTSVLP